MILRTVAGPHSFVITLSNNRTESEGSDFVLNSCPDVFLPDAAGRTAVMNALGLKRELRRAFDLIRVEGAKADHNQLGIANPQLITLIELKTTKKHLPNNPFGFFFGATANEFEVATTLGKQFQFGFVCLHPECKSVRFLSLADLEPLIQSKRIQFQVNLRRKPDAEKP